MLMTAQAGNDIVAHASVLNSFPVWVDQMHELKQEIQEKYQQQQEQLRLINYKMDFERFWLSKLLASLPQSFQSLLFVYCKDQFALFSRSFLEEEMEDFENAITFKSFCSRVSYLGLFPMLESVVTEVLYQSIEHHVAQHCSQIFDRSLMTECKAWLQNCVLKWLDFVFTNDAQKFNLNNWENRFSMELYRVFFDLRVSEIFDIVVDYPDSEPALNDLRECMCEIDDSATFLKALQSSISRRLLHQGATTGVILSQYLAIIKCMKIIDPSNKFINKISVPIQLYLRTRSDTSRCVISMLIDVNNAEMFNNFESEELTASSKNHLMDDDFFQNENKKLDILTRMISIFDSKDVYLNEFQKLLAEKLYNRTDYNCDDEIRNLEVMKTRFGENSLHVCEVMLKDMADSRRGDNLIRSHNSQFTHPLHAIVSSRLFWPAIPPSSDVFQVHPSLKTDMDSYAKEFEVIKAARKLEWIPHVGTVSLELEFQDRKLELNVSPLQATVAMYFEDQVSMEFAHLQEKSKIAAGLLRQALSFWISKSVIKEIRKHTYQVVEIFDSSAEQASVHENEEQGGTSETDQTIESMRVYWTFVQGMLTNLGSLPLDRIHSMLNMFAKVPTPYSKTSAELKRFLEVMVQEEKVEYVDGMYKLKK